MHAFHPIPRRTGGTGPAAHADATAPAYGLRRGRARRRTKPYAGGTAHSRRASGAGVDRTRAGGDPARRLDPFPKAACAGESRRWGSAAGKVSHGSTGGRWDQ
ncbi:hypothetical protein GCM10018962_79070 [Dactylosporangium matsuzakiense]|uniref:Uncharacterized protein n=1 Tax=Dactylosporangium matsuzakiense TaxID=53360 RepID=A0A9W6KGG6_9ACTN|nr:hypothetical protein GCM10017581_033930 [Dactylosporangium matsuzakiense]